MSWEKFKLERVRKNFDLPKYLIEDCELIAKNYPSRYRNLTQLIEIALEEWTTPILKKIDNAHS